MTAGELMSFSKSDVSLRSFKNLINVNVTFKADLETSRIFEFIDMKNDVRGG